ncbi:tetratricopeptide repeat protein [Microbispora amethystogenes]|uniref:tetratricopeptide repeat protein n=1 Tax=Microbispora amethystogenes TaxID=1427754 RepID=UPI00340A7DF3
MTRNEPLGDTGGDHVEFHHNVIGKAVGVEHHHHYPAAPERAPGQIVEGDIPQRPPGFQPREQLSQRLAGLLGDQAPATHADTGRGGAVVICAMAGTPGVGKTMLAASYAWACQAAGWPVVAWIAAETTGQIVTGLAALADRLGERRPDDDAAMAAARAKAWLAATNRPALLVFDNAADVGTVRSWCPATGATRVVITTRNRAFLRACEPLEVEVFTPAQAAAFLHDRTGLTDPGGAAELAAELGHLPLALAQAAAVIIRLQLGYTGYLELLRSFTAGDYLPAQDGDAYPTGTAQAILLSVTQAESALPAARRVLPILAVLSPAGVPLPMSDNPSDPDAQARVREMFAGLADTSLITFTEDGTTILMHRLVQRVIRERAARQGDLGTALDDATELLHIFDSAIPDGPLLWKTRDVVEILVEQTGTLYGHASDAGALTADLLGLRARCGKYLIELADLPRAVPLLERVVADCERVLGPDHFDTLVSRNKLAHAYLSAEDLTRAIPLLEQVVAGCDRTLGPGSRHTLGYRVNLARARREAGDLARAVLLYERVLADCERALGPDDPVTLLGRDGLARIYQEAGDLLRAIPLLERTLAGRERVLGVDHPDTLTSRNHLANACRAAGDLARAVPLHERTLAEGERVLGPDHPDTLGYRNNLANAYQEAGYPARALPLYRHALADCERVLGSGHPTTLLLRHNLEAARRSSRGWRRWLLRLSRNR